MGLLSVLSDEDAILCRSFFLAAYSGNYEKLYEMIAIYGDLSEEEKKLLKEDLKKYSEQVKSKDVTFYFTDLINVCYNYEIVPPNFLFSMAKAFLCLNGISNFTGNKFTAIEMLQEQTVEFLIKRSLNDCKELILDGIYLPPECLENISRNGFANTIAKLSSNTKIHEDLRKSLENFKEMLGLIKSTKIMSSDTPYKRIKH